MNQVINRRIPKLLPGQSVKFTIVPSDIEGLPTGATLKNVVLTVSNSKEFFITKDKSEENGFILHRKMRATAPRSVSITAILKELHPK